MMQCMIATVAIEITILQKVVRSNEATLIGQREDADGKMDPFRAERKARLGF
jgi:hypothetical protein